MTGEDLVLTVQRRNGDLTISSAAGEITSDTWVDLEAWR